MPVSGNASSATRPASGAPICQTTIGSTSMPVDLGVWINYVRALVTHYSPANWAGIRGIAAYQVWNEANVTGYWTGTPQQMAVLTEHTYNAVKSIDRGALVVSPAFAARIGRASCRERVLLGV